jgi:hypothetical protein
MGNLLISAPPGAGIRPYGSAGLGLIRSHIGGAGDLFDDLTINDFGINLGGDVNGQFNENVGIRSDIRYFRSLQDNEPDIEFDLGCV